MNYRHAFHAGNHADVLKHCVLLACLDRQVRKPAPLAVLDAFAGAGAYDLTSDEAARSPEWRDGIGRLLDWADAPDVLHPLIAAAKDARYPGSPRLILDRLRPHDRLIACDLHPEENAKLRTAVGADPRVQLHLRDGFGALAALLPVVEKRGLILLDPPYEKPDELDRSVAALKAGVQRFRQGVYVWWRPEKPSLGLDRADRDLIAATGLPWLRAGLAIADPQSTTKLVSSSVFILNPPFGLGDALHTLLPDLAARLGFAAGWGLDAA